MFSGVLIFSLSFFLALSKDGYPNVNVTIYAETECPCWGMFQYEFHNLVMSTDVGSIIDLYVFWDGTAEPDGNISCFHGPTECQSSILQQCAMTVSNWDMTNPQMYYEYMNYTYCIYGNCKILIRSLPDCQYLSFIGTDLDFMLEREKQCAEMFGLNWNEIETCYNNGTGLKMTWQSMKHGNDAGEIYGLQGLPVVWINEVRFSTFWDCDAYETQMQPFIQQVCDDYQGPKPQGCNQDRKEKM